MNHQETSIGPTIIHCDESLEVTLVNNTNRYPRLTLGRIVELNGERAFQFRNSGLLFQSGMRPDVLRAIADLTERAMP